MKNNSCTCVLCKKKCLCKPYADFFDTLGHVSRLHIITALKEGPRSVTQLSTETGLEQTHTSHCLRKLQKGGFVDSQRQGRFKIYTLNKKTTEPLMQLIDDHVSKYYRPS